MFLNRIKAFYRLSNARANSLTNLVPKIKQQLWKMRELDATDESKEYINGPKATTWIPTHLNATVKRM